MKTDFLLGTLLNQDLKIKVVDIGANPIDDSPPYARLLQAGTATVVGFEPNPDALAALNRTKSPNETYLPWAVGDGERHTLHICVGPGMTSLLPPNPAMLNLFNGFPQWGHIQKMEEVDTVRLDDIAETEGVDMIKLDIQGAELMALRHAEQRLSQTLVIQSEAEFLPLYADQPLFSDLETYLRGKGFMFHRFFPLVSRTIAPFIVNNDIYSGLSQIVWCDAIFVRDLTRLEELTDEQILKMAIILHDCYGSVDLVFRLLTEWDARRQTHTHEAYLLTLQASLAPSHT